jgi:hypothetical protein
VDTWSKKHKSCKNCLTDRHPHIARGFCARCYPLARRLDELERRELRDSASMKHFPNSLRQFVQNQAVLEGFRTDAREQIRSRLNEIRLQEEKLSAKIDGIDIENQLNRIAKIIVPKAKTLYQGSASLIECEFSLKQRNLLYSLLNRMEETRPWVGVRYGKHTANGMLKAFIQKVTKNQSDE